MHPRRPRCSYADAGLLALVHSSRPPSVAAGLDDGDGPVPKLNLVVAGIVSIVAGGLILEALSVKHGP